MLMENIDWQKSGDAIDEAESAEIYEQNMMQRGKAAREIADKLRFGPMLTEARMPENDLYETTQEDYLGRDYSEEVMSDDRIAADTKRTYTDIIYEHPELKAIKIVSTPGDAGGTFEFWKESEEEDATEQDKRPHMEIIGDFSDDVLGDKISEAAYYASKLTAIRLAVELGCSSRDIILNPKLQRDIVLLHEMGHANNLINGYIKPLYRRVRKELAMAENIDVDKLDLEDPTFAMGMSLAVHEYKRRTYGAYNLKTLSPGSTMIIDDAINAGLCAAGEEDAYVENAYKRLELRFKAGGANNLDEVIVEDARRYRLFEEEHSADEFALDYVRRHLDKYFLEPGDEPDDSGRVPRSGGEVDVSGAFGVALNCVGGNEVMIKSLQGGAVSSGRFVKMPYQGGDFCLTTSDDPDDWKAVKNYGIVEEVNCRTIVDENGKAHLRTIVYMDSGDYLMMEPKEVHRPISRSPEELKTALGIEKGKELQMMSLLVGRRDSDYQDDEGEYGPAIGGGGILYGKIYEDIEIGQPVVMGVPDGEGLSEWRSWPVESIEQDWRTWRINTRVGEKRASYEIIPLPE